jgi:predicted DCC family thiol-disulfide oxidoreductase YuxK
MEQMTSETTCKARAAVVFDGECSFCRRQIAWIRLRDTNGAFEYVPRQTVGLVNRFPTLARGEFETGIRVVAPDGDVSVGADAVYEITRRLPRWRTLASFYRIPGCGAIARLAYRWIAANRSRFYREPCDEGCELSVSVQKGDADG